MLYLPKSAYDALKFSSALIPFWRSDLKSLSIASGSHTFHSTIFHSRVPSKIITKPKSSTYQGQTTSAPQTRSQIGLVPGAQ